MARGFFGGFIRGTLLGVGGLGLFSIYNGWEPPTRVPESTILDVPAGSQFNQSRQDNAVIAPAPIESPTFPALPSVTPPSVEAPDQPQDLAQDLPSLPVANDAAPAAPASETANITPDVGLPQPEMGIVPPTLPNSDLRPTAPRIEQNDLVQDGPVQPQLQDDQSIPSTPPIDAGVIDIPQDPAPAPSVFETQTPKTFDSGEYANTLPMGQSLPLTQALPQDEEVAVDVPTPLGRAIDLFATQNVDTFGKPMLSFVVILDGRTRLDPAMIEALTFPISFAIDPSSPFAGDDMETLRALGQEVLALAEVPSGASAQDAEITLASVLNQIPSAVAVLELREGGLQTSRDSNAQVPEILARSGHGLLVYEKGLTAILREAEKRGLPASSIYKDLDGQGQNDRTIRRFLDGAVMRASSGDQGGAVVVARLKPDTISSLLMWGFQDRVTRVAIVPVSQLLKEIGDR